MRIVITGPDSRPVRPREPNLFAEALAEGQVIGRLWCHHAEGRVSVEYAYVEEAYRRRRVGHALMYELERRYPGLTTSEAQGIGCSSIPSWFFLRARIMAEGPYAGRPDLGEYVSDVLENADAAQEAPPC
ncbi:MAG TPA: GNAT family N-acetyltransferase [Pirellulales bacterium]|nr:GNAT family N-acetyltransferase [Pirellulales bacterium]